MSEPTTNIARRVVRAPGPVDPNYTQEETVNPETGGVNVHVAGGVITPSTPYSSPALEASAILKAGDGTFRSLLVELDANTPTGTYYVQLLTGSATVPPDGAVTFLRPPMTVAHEQGFPDFVTFDEGDAGITFTVGCTACISTDRFTKTEAGAYGLFSGSVL